MIYDLDKYLLNALNDQKGEIARITELDPDSITAHAKLSDHYPYTVSAWLSTPDETLVFQDRTRVFARFDLSELPGNGDILVSHDVWVGDEYKGRGLGTLLLRLREHVCGGGNEMLGAQALLATVSNYNDTEKHLLRKHNWEQLTPTPVGVHGVHIFIKQLTKEG